MSILNKKIFWSFVCLQIMFLFFMIYSKEMHVRNGRKIKIRFKYEESGFFRENDILRFHYDMSVIKVDYDRKIHKGIPVYTILEKEDNDIWKYSDYSFAEPDRDKVYIKGYIRYFNRNRYKRVLSLEPLKSNAEWYKKNIDNVIIPETVYDFSQKSDEEHDFAYYVFTENHEGKYIIKSFTGYNDEDKARKDWEYLKTDIRIFRLNLDKGEEKVELRVNYGIEELFIRDKNVDDIRKRLDEKSLIALLSVDCSGEALLYGVE